MRIAIALVLSVVFSGCTISFSQSTIDGEDATEPGSDPALLAEFEALASNPVMRISTDYGDMDLVLYESWLPTTGAHIRGLAESGFYDDTIVHRVVDDFVIQGGDPTGTGEGGSGPGGLSTNPVPLEIKPGLHFGLGGVGLARWTDDTGDSQWFITEKPQPHLSSPSGPTGAVFGAYSMFGQLVGGLEVLQTIAEVETIPELDRPVDDVHVPSVEIVDVPVDWINVVQDYRAFDMGGANGFLQWPRHLVSNHTFQMHWIEEAEAASSRELVFTHENETVAPVRFQLEQTVDASTLNATVLLPRMGGWNVAVGDHRMQLYVYPWHDDYAPYALP